MWLNLLSITDNLKIVPKFSVGGQDRLFKSRIYFMNEMYYKTYQINSLIFQRQYVMYHSIDF